MNGTPASVLSDKHLGIVSDCPHYRGEDGTLWALSPVVRQFEQWATLASRVTVCAPLGHGTPPRGTSAYQRANITLLPVPEAGGNTVVAKLRLLTVLPSWIRAVRRLFRSVDAVHLRAPNNIGIVALVLSTVRPRFVQAVYTGNWAGYPGEPPTYRFQRTFLAKRFRGPVFVYPTATPATGRVVETFSPIATDAEWTDAQAGWTTASRTGRVLVSVGALNRNKGQSVAIRILAGLRQRGIDATLVLIGEGPERSALESLAAGLGVASAVDFRGALPHADVCAALLTSDFFLLPSGTEGFSKAILEALTYGVVPVITDLPANRLLTGHGAHGHVFDPADPGSAIEYIASLSLDDAMRRDVAARCAATSRRYTLDSWRQHLADELARFWTVGALP